MSIAARTAEGCGGHSNVEFANDLRRAAAQSSEVEYYLLVAKDLGPLKDLRHLKEEMEASLTGRVIEARKMITGLLRKL